MCNRMIIFITRRVFILAAWLIQAGLAHGTETCTSAANREVDRQISIRAEAAGASTDSNRHSPPPEVEIPAEDTLMQLAPNAAGVLENFDLLLRTARTEAGPRTVARMAEAIRESEPGIQKQEAVERFLDYLTRVLKEGHESISGHEALRAMGAALFNPDYSVRPSWGADQARKVFERCLESPDYRIRNEAFNGLFRIAIVFPSLGERIFTDLKAQYEKEKQADDYDEEPSSPPGYLKERALRKMEQCFEAMAGRRWEDLQVLTDEQYTAMKKMKREELFDLVRRGGHEETFAVSSLLSAGCDDYTMDRLLDIARHKGGPAMSSLVQSVAGTVARQIKDNVATAEDRSRLERFLSVLAQELDSPESSMGRAAVAGIYRVVSVFKYQEGRGIHRYAPESDPAITLLIGALDHNNHYVRRDAISHLGHIAMLDSSRRSGIIKILRDQRDKTVMEPACTEKDVILADLDSLIRRAQAQMSRQSK